jgi:hypothetical protein
MSAEISSSRKPSHRLYVVVGEGSEATWIPVGAAWPNRDGQGYGIELDAVPLHGRLAMRMPKAKAPAADESRD